MRKSKLYSGRTAANPNVDLAVVDATNQPCRRRIARRLTGLLGFALTLGAANSRAATVTISDSASYSWEASGFTNNPNTYSYNVPGVSFAPATFDVTTFLDSNPGDFNTPYGVLMFPNGTNMLANNTYTRAGTVFDVGSFYQNGPGDTFINTGAFTGGAQAGSDNYVGFEVADSAGQEHYGWLQYTFASYSVGATAVSFTAGYLSDLPNVPVVTGAVPEPSTVAFAAVGLCALAGWLRRRRAA